MIPDYQTLMLPLLELLSDGNVHRRLDLVDILGKQFQLSEEELKEILPNSKTGKKVFNNRIHWAQSHLKMAGLIEFLEKFSTRITDRGRLLLAEKPKSLSLQEIKSRFADFDKKIKLESNLSSTLNTEAPPEELMANLDQKLKLILKQDLLSKLKSIHPRRFEEIVVELIVKMGYGGSRQEAGKAIGKSGDEGIDGIINEDKLGLDTIYIQAKRWEGVVGRPELHKFIGALAGQNARKGIFITTSYFSKEALNFIPRNETKIVLIDGEKLAQYMIDYNLGVALQNTYEIKRLNSDYFEEDV